MAFPMSSTNGRRQCPVLLMSKMAAGMNVSFVCSCICGCDFGCGCCGGCLVNIRLVMGENEKKEDEEEE